MVSDIFRGGERATETTTRQHSAENLNMETATTTRRQHGLHGASLGLLTGGLDMGLCESLNVFWGVRIWGADAPLGLSFEKA